MIEEQNDEIKSNFYTLKDLQDVKVQSMFLQSETLPFSSLRLQSYLHNPRAKPEDVLLISISKSDKIIAYLTMVPDDMHIGIKRLHFVWLSGMWVSPDFRRRGLGKQLAILADEAWEGRLIGTEYTPTNEIVLLSSKIFELPIYKSGTLFYYKSIVKEILNTRYPNLKWLSPLYSLIDKTINVYASVKRKIYFNPNFKSKYSFIPTKELSEVATKYLNEAPPYSSTNRRSTELQWISDYPWISSDLTTKEASKQYYFSTYSENYTFDFIEIYHNKSIIGLVVLSFRDGVLKIPYFWASELELTELAKYIINFAQKLGAKKLISYHSLLNKQLISKDRFNIFYKRTKRKYLISKQLKTDSSLLQFNFEDGDGDCVFV